jgi:O-antigen/teichoic acid export membrane protein
VSAQAAVVAPPRAARTGAHAGAWLLSAAMLGSGVLTYAFHVLAARTLGTEAYGRIAVLWAAVFLGAVVLYRPLEQTLSRATAERLARGQDARPVLRTIALLMAAVLAVAGVAVALAWRLLTDRLFLGDQALTAAFVVALAGYGLSYVVRGLLGGARWFGGYALVLLADAVARLAVAAPLVVIASTRIAGAAVAAAGVAGAIVPLAVGRGKLRPMLRARRGPPFPLRAAVAFAAPASAIAIADQVLVNGAPLLVAATGGASASRMAGVVFAATMLVRVPVYVFQGLAASILPNLTKLHVEADAVEFRRAVAKIAGTLLAAGAAMAAGAAAFGPEAMRLFYGRGFDAGRLALVLLALGVAGYLATSAFSQALLAIDRARAAAAGWTFAAAAFVALYEALPGGEVLRVAVAFAAAMAAAPLLLGAALTRRDGPA